MTRSELAAKLAARIRQMSPRDAAHAIDVILTEMRGALARGQRIEIRGFGSFCVRTRPARIGRNPSTGEPLEIPEKRLPHFRPSWCGRI
jgi:integration host factor subunit beta